jgi:nicotinamidase-related amidase
MIKNTALLSIDNTQWFENKSLNELYVNEWEQAAKATKQIVDLCRGFWVQIINVFDNHPLWHVLFSVNYKNKNPYDIISLDEVSDWTEEKNGVSSRASFSLSELKDYLSKAWPQVLWPDHCIHWTQWATLMAPLKDSDFDIHIPKWEKEVNSWYSAFDHTNLDSVLKEWWKKTLILSWVATDYCVWQTALDAKNLWYEPYIIREAVRWVSPDTTEKMIEKLKNSWIRIITKNELIQLLNS